MGEGNRIEACLGNRFIMSVFAIFQTLSRWFRLVTFFTANFPRVLLLETASKSKEGKENLSSFAHFVIELGQQKKCTKKCDMRANFFAH